MLETISKVITFFQADTSDMKAGLKELKGAEKELAQEQLKAADDRNKGYESWKKSLTEVNSALEIVGKVVNVAKESFKAYADDLRIRSAAGAVSIDKLKAASLGLRTEHDLMTFAAQTQRGVIKANEDQMATAQAAMVGLTRAGFDQSEVTKKVTDAMISLKVNGLDDLGITVKKGATDVETYSNLMAELAKHAKGVEGGTLSASEGVDQMGVTMAESMDKMKQALGQLVAAMLPLLNALAKAVGYVAELAKGHADVRAAGGAAQYVLNQQMKEQGKVPDPERPGMFIDEGSLRARQAIRGFAGQGNFDTGVYKGFAGFGNYGAAAAQQSQAAYGGFSALGSLADVEIDPWTKGTISTAIDTFMDKAMKDAKEGKLSKSELKDLALQAARMRAEATMRSATMEAGGASGRSFSGSMGAAAGYATDGEQGMLERIEGERTAALTADWNKRLAEQQTKRESFLLSTFGPLEEFNVYKAAFESLTAAVGASYEALITGAQPAGQAFKRMFADMLMGIGKTSAVQALKELAYAAGSAAYGNFAGAALHLKSAGLHTAVAVAAGVAASQIGTSAQGQASDKAASEKSKADEKAEKDREKAAGKGGGSGSGSGGTERPIVVIVGSEFGDDTPRMKSIRANEAVEKAIRLRDE